MSTVLVTGGAGYIGSHTCKALDAIGISPVVLDNLSTGHKQLVQWGELIQGDVRDTDFLSQTIKRIKPEAIIHFAASAYVGESFTKPQKYYDNNISGVLSLLKAMAANDCKHLVFSSTCAVYGVPDKLPIDVSAATNPINPYGRTKLMAEQIIQDFANSSDLRAVILRYFNAAGADTDGQIGERHIPEPHLIPNVINAALDQEPRLQVFGDDYPTADGTCVRDYVHVNDLAKAHVQSLDYLNNTQATLARFNLGAEQGVSIKQVIAEVEAQTGKQVPHDICPRRPGDPATLFADSSFTQKQLGWQATQSDLASIVASALAWAKLERK